MGGENLSEEPGFDPGYTNERVRFICSFDVWDICNLLRICCEVEGNKYIPQIKSARFKNELTSIRPLLLNSGRQTSRVRPHKSRRSHSSMYIRQRIKISGRQDKNTKVSPYCQGRELRDTHEKQGYQGENWSSFRSTIPRFQTGEKPSRTHISRPC